MNGIQIKYAELLRLSVEQLFYQNKLYKQNTTLPQLDMLIAPTADCLDVMTRMNMVFKNTDINSGFVVLARVSGTNGSGNDIMRFPARNDDILTFLLLLKNHDVVNFNDLPAAGLTNSVYYFNNQVTDAAATRDNLHLSIAATGVDGASDFIKTSTESYRFHYTATVVPGAAKVRHILTGQLVEPASIANQGGQSDLAFDLSSLPMGKCELLIANVSKDQFYYLEKYESQKVFGIIELSLASTLAANYRIIEADRSLVAQKPFYTITFNNRKTIWRYTIRLQNTSPLFLEMAALSPADKTTFINELDIVTNDTTITFSRDTITDNEFVFVSDNPLALSEKYISSTSLTHDPLNLTLKKYIGDVSKEAAVRGSLPFPSTVSIDASSTTKIYSDIFLTI
jgi:hypothetical protein